MKIDKDSIKKEYEDNLDNYKKLAELVHYELVRKIKPIKIQPIVWRIKDLGSLLDKVRRRKIEKPFEQIHDIVGLRVICLFRPDIEKIKSIICEEFEVFQEDDKASEMEPNMFGYMDLHLKAKLKSSFESPDGEKVKQIPFEIQVRTITQDAWASISHYLDYKKESLIPEQLKKDFYALSGLFYVADTHFSFIWEKNNVAFEKDIK
ncbi:MAG TPA: hypothetical protein DCY12_09210 [Candidatus Atribacteria bacterium]|nr:hypothetical protein [Candidatus Atribacteria bacterium]